MSIFATKRSVSTTTHTLLYPYPKYVLSQLYLKRERLCKVLCAQSLSLTLSPSPSLSLSLSLSLSVSLSLSLSLLFYILDILSSLLRNVCQSKNDNSRFKSRLKKSMHMFDSGKFGETARLRMTKMFS